VEFLGTACWARCQDTILSTYFAFTSLASLRNACRGKFSHETVYITRSQLSQLDLLWLDNSAGHTFVGSALQLDSWPTSNSNLLPPACSLHPWFVAALEWDGMSCTCHTGECWSWAPRNGRGSSPEAEDWR